MSTNLQLDDEIVAAETITGSATGFGDRLVALVRAAFHSSVNPFGSACALDVGTASGELPALGADGRLAAERLPAATNASIGAMRFATASEIAARADGVAVSAEDLNALVASDTVPGLVRRATAQHVTDAANVNRYVRPVDVPRIAGPRPVAVVPAAPLTVGQAAVELDMGVTIADFTSVLISYRPTGPTGPTGSHLAVRALLPTADVDTYTFADRTTDWLTEGSQPEERTTITDAHVNIHDATTLRFIATRSGDSVGAPASTNTFGTVLGVALR